jgi:hypothetical protein
MAGGDGGESAGSLSAHDTNASGEDGDLVSDEIRGRMIDPRRPWRNDDVPNMRSVTVAELRHWLNTDPRRWAAAAAVAFSESSDDLDEVLIGWFAAAFEAGGMEAARRGTVRSGD